MKADAPKRKIFNDVVDLLSTREQAAAGSGVEMLDKGEMQLTAAVQLSYLPEQGQRMALEVSEKSGINITEKIAKEIRKTKMTEKDSREAIAGPNPEINKLTGKPILPEEKPKPIRLSGAIRVKYFSDTDLKEVQGIVDKALAAWFKKRR